MATAFIKLEPPSKKRRTFGSVVFDHMPDIQGWFVGMLPGKKNDSGTLHWANNRRLTTNGEGNRQRGCTAHAADSQSITWS